MSDVNTNTSAATSTGPSTSTSTPSNSSSTSTAATTATPTVTGASTSGESTTTAPQGFAAIRDKFKAERDKQQQATEQEPKPETSTGSQQQQQQQAQAQQAIEEMLEVEGHKIPKSKLAEMMKLANGDFNIAYDSVKERDRLWRLIHGNAQKKFDVAAQTLKEAKQREESARRLISEFTAQMQSGGQTQQQKQETAAKIQELFTQEELADPITGKTNSVLQKVLERIDALDSNVRSGGPQYKGQLKMAAAELTKQHGYDVLSNAVKVAGVKYGAKIDEAGQVDLSEVGPDMALEAIGAINAYASNLSSLANRNVEMTESAFKQHGVLSLGPVLQRMIRDTTRSACLEDVTAGVPLNQERISYHVGNIVRELRAQYAQDAMKIADSRAAEPKPVIDSGAAPGMPKPNITNSNTDDSKPRGFEAIASDFKSQLDRMSQRR